MTEEDRISVVEYINRRLLDMNDLFEARVTALEKATTIAAAQMEKRLEGMNEFRAQLKDQASTFADRTRTEADIRELRESRAELRGLATQADVGRASRVAMFGVVAAIISLVLSVVGLALAFLS